MALLYRRVARLFPRCPETPLVAEGGGVNSKMRMRSMHIAAHAVQYEADGFWLSAL